MSEVKFDPSKRRLCPDGACIGVIGDDGRCRVCGRASNGSSTAAPATPSAAAGDPFGADNEEDDAWTPEDGADSTRSTAAGDPTGGFQPGRRLCDDGSCIGVIGGDGRCSVCGRAGGG
jgi:hypothetical protein